MSLHFDWGRLDETCAEALRHLINSRLAEVVDRINNRNAAPSDSSTAGPAAAGAKATAVMPIIGPSVAGAALSVSVGSHGAGAEKAETSLHTSGIVSRQEIASGITTIPGNVVHHATHFCPESIPNLFTHSTTTSTAPLHSSYMQTSNSSAAISGFSSATPASAAAIPPTGSVGGPVGSGGSNVAGTGGSISAPVLGCATSQHNCSHHNIGATLAVSETNASAGSGGPSAGNVFASEPISVTPSATQRAVLGQSSPGFDPGGSTTATSSAGPTSAAGGGIPACAGAAASGGASKIPPIVYLEVGRIDWGTSPPFVEIVGFENAIDGPPGRTRQRSRQQHPSRGALLSGGRDGHGTGVEARGNSPYSVSHTTSMDTLNSSTAAVDLAAGLSAMADSFSEGSHGLASRVYTESNTPHLFGGTHSLFDAASVCGASASGRADMPPRNPVSLPSQSQYSSPPDSVDTLASVLGPGGLHVRFHMTYGGAMHLSLNVAVQHEIRLGAVALRLSLPMTFYLANLDLDCFVCVNMKENMCEVWLEPGLLSPFIVNRLSIIATIGGDDAECGSDLDGGRKNSGTGDYGTSSADFYSRFGSSSVSDNEGAEEGNGVYVNEHEVSQFVLHELRAILRETLVAPHSVCIPISFGGGDS